MTLQKSDELFRRAKLVTPGGVHSPVRAFKHIGTTPKFIDRAKDAFLYDVDGQRYTDYCMSWGPLILGHADPDVAEAVTRQIEKGWSFGATERYSLELAEFLTTEIPWLEQIRFVNSGTEAVMSALRVARAATGRDKIVKFDGCYHGHVDSMLVRAGSGLAEMANPDSAGVSKNTASETIVAPLNDEKAIEDIFANHGDKIAALIIEPVPANNGLLLQRPKFLEHLQTLCKRYGALFILDEVISGFRIGFQGAAQYYQLKPDLVTYGKIIGGGFPVGAFGGRRDLMSLVAPQGNVYQAGTLSGNPVAMVAGLSTLKKLKQLNPYIGFSDRTMRLGTLINEGVKNDVGLNVTPQSIGSIFWLALGTPVVHKESIRTPAEIPATQKSLYAPMFSYLLNHGIYLAPSGFEVGFLATVHTDEQVDKLAVTIVAALKQISSQ